MILEQARQLTVYILDELAALSEAFVEAESQGVYSRTISMLYIRLLANLRRMSLDQTAQREMYTWTLWPKIKRNGLDDA